MYINSAERARPSRSNIRLSGGLGNPSVAKSASSEKWGEGITIGAAEVTRRSPGLRGGYAGKSKCSRRLALREDVTSGQFKKLLGIRFVAGLSLSLSTKAGRRQIRPSPGSDQVREIVWSVGLIDIFLDP
jgi:hypothetical protein